jgi:hypothetical protein
MTTVLLDNRVLEPFVADALRQYRKAWQTARDGAEQYLPRCWALLIGRVDGPVMRVERLHFAGNVRETDETVLTEFSEVIVPCFGTTYAHGRRGFWCDPRELLRLTRAAEAEGREVLGSVHMHADVHRFWPSHAAGQVLSEQPTAMDEYLFRNTGWPLNLICHLESSHDEIGHNFGAWAPPSFDDPEDRSKQLLIRYLLATFDDREV